MKNTSLAANFYGMLGIYDHCEEVIITGQHADSLKVEIFLKKPINILNITN